MMKTFLGIATGVALSAMVSSAFATTVNLTSFGTVNELRGQATLGVGTIDERTIDDLKVGALRMRITDTDASFIAWCFQVARELVVNAEYTVQASFLGSGLSSRQSDDLSRLFTGFQGEANSRPGASAFQLAIWEIVEEKSVDPSSGLVVYDVLNGDFRARTTSSDTAAGIANGWLERLGEFGADTEITYLTSGASQDILTIAPIPLPASILLLGAGIGALVVVRRRGKPAAEV